MAASKLADRRLGRVLPVRTRRALDGRGRRRPRPRLRRTRPTLSGSVSSASIAEAGEVCSCDLLEPLGKSQPTISHHTKALAEAGLISGEKRGRWVWWRIVPERLDAIRLALE